MSLQTLALSDPNNYCLHYPQGGRRRWTTSGVPTLSTTTTELHSGSGLPTCMLAYILKRGIDLKSTINWLNHPTIFLMMFSPPPTPQRCYFWDGEWQSTTADPSGSTSCFPFKTPHQWRLGEWAHGAPGPGHGERKWDWHHSSTSHSEAVGTHDCAEASLASHSCYPSLVLGAHHRRRS